MATDEVGSLSKKITALESSGFSSDEINQIMRRLGSAAPITTERIYGETISSWLVTYALPSIVVLGTGALFYFLTGGDDELPSSVEEPCENRSLSAAASSGRIENIDSDSALDERSDFLSENPDRLIARPFRNPATYVVDDGLEQNHRADSLFGDASERWLKELLIVTNTIAADVKAMKDEIGKLQNVPKVGTDDLQSLVIKDDETVASDNESAISSVIAPPKLSTDEYLIILRSAFTEILNSRQPSIIPKNPTDRDKPQAAAPQANMTVESSKSCLESGTANDEVFKKGCGALAMYIRNVLGNPSMPRYRKVSTSNASFKSLVLPLVGHAKILDAVGFKLSGIGGSSYEWMWRIEADQPSGTGAAANTGKPDGAGVTIILTECVRLFEICIAGGVKALQAELLLLNSSLVTTAAAASSSSSRSLPEVEATTSAQEISSHTVSTVSGDTDSNSRAACVVAADSSSDGSSTDSPPGVEVELEPGKSIPATANMQEPTSLNCLQKTDAVSSLDILKSDNNLSSAPTPLSSFGFNDVMQIIAKPQAVAKELLPG